MNVTECIGMYSGGDNISPCRGSQKNTGVIPFSSESRDAISVSVRPGLCRVVRLSTQRAIADFIHASRTLLVRDS